jgi:electron transport complex protein RnfG
MSKVKYFLEQSWLIIICAFIFGLLLSLTNAAWAPIIENNQREKLNELMKTLITEADNFEIAVENTELIPGQKTDIYKAVDSSGQVIGYAFRAVGSGFADKIELVIAVDTSW